MPRKLLAVVLAMLLMLPLAACSSGSLGQGLGHYVEKQEAAASEPQKAEINPYTDANFSDTLGFSVVQVANTNTVSPVKYFTIDGWFGQVEFLTSDGLVLVLRVARDKESPLSTTYRESHTASSAKRTVDDVEIDVRMAKEGCCAVSWQRDGYQYYLHSNKSQGPPPDADVDAVVSGTRCAE